MVVCAMKVSRHFTSVCMLTLVTVNAVLLASGDRTLEAALPQNNSINRLQGSISSQSDDIKSIRNSTAPEVQVLKNIEYPTVLKYCEAYVSSHTVTHIV